MKFKTDKSNQPISLLSKLLIDGSFIVTGELTLPDSPYPEKLVENALQLNPYCDVLNLTDATSATPHFSSLAAACLLIQNGIEPIMQISCRDRNRIAIQGDVVGAHALGVRNLLCVTGDGVEAGDHPSAKAVFDLDSITLISTLSNLAKTGSFESGRELDSDLDLILGGAVNPFAPPYDFRPHRLMKKVKAGASFFQSQFCFDTTRLRDFLDVLQQISGGEFPPVIVGVGPLRSARVAQWMAANVPGVYVPQSLIDRLSKHPRKDQSNVGLEIAYEIVDDIKTIPGVSGIHIMAYKWESAVVSIVENSGLSKSSRGTNL
jgi:5,10-methylenetetrahydrofolate reductase